jgi:hypothetical protein
MARAAGLASKPREYGRGDGNYAGQRDPLASAGTSVLPQNRGINAADYLVAERLIVEHKGHWELRAAMSLGRLYQSWADRTKHALLLSKSMPGSPKDSIPWMFVKRRLCSTNCRVETRILGNCQCSSLAAKRVPPRAASINILKSLPLALRRFSTCS